MTANYLTITNRIRCLFWIIGAFGIICIKYTSGLLCEDCPAPCEYPGVCTTTEKCFVRRDVNGIIYRGCADRLRWKDLDLSQNGCTFQAYLGWNQTKALWCFCDVTLCNRQEIQHFPNGSYFLSAIQNDEYRIHFTVAKKASGQGAESANAGKKDKIKAKQFVPSKGSDDTMYTPQNTRSNHNVNNNNRAKNSNRPQNPQKVSSFRVMFYNVTDSNENRKQISDADGKEGAERQGVDLSGSYRPPSMNGQSVRIPNQYYRQWNANRDNQHYGGIDYRQNTGNIRYVSKDNNQGHNNRDHDRNSHVYVVPSHGQNIRTSYGARSNRIKQETSSNNLHPYPEKAIPARTEFIQESEPGSDLKDYRFTGSKTEDMNSDGIDKDIDQSIDYLMEYIFENEAEEKRMEKSRPKPKVTNKVPTEEHDSTNPESDRQLDNENMNNINLERKYEIPSNLSFQESFDTEHVELSNSTLVENITASETNQSDDDEKQGKDAHAVPKHLLDSNYGINLKYGSQNNTVTSDSDVEHSESQNGEKLENIVDSFQLKGNKSEVLSELGGEYAINTTLKPPYPSSTTLNGADHTVTDEINTEKPVAYADKLPEIWPPNYTLKSSIQSSMEKSAKMAKIEDLALESIRNSQVLNDASLFSKDKVNEAEGQILSPYEGLMRDQVKEGIMKSTTKSSDGDIQNSVDASSNGEKVDKNMSDHFMDDILDSNKQFHLNLDDDPSFANIQKTTPNITELTKYIKNHSVSNSNHTLNDNTVEGIFTTADSLLTEDMTSFYDVNVTRESADIREKLTQDAEQSTEWITAADFSSGQAHDAEMEREQLQNESTAVSYNTSTVLTITTSAAESSNEAINTTEEITAVDLSNGEAITVAGNLSSEAAVDVSSDSAAAAGSQSSHVKKLYIKLSPFIEGSSTQKNISSCGVVYYQESRCPAGYVYLAKFNSCYRFSRKSHNFGRSRSLCRRDHPQADLVGLETYAEYQCIADWAESLPVLIDGWQGWWTGGHYRDGIRSFVWSHDNRMIEKTQQKWLPNLVIHPFDKTCVWLVPLSEYVLGNYWCAEPSGFICEIKL